LGGNSRFWILQQSRLESGFLTSFVNVNADACGVRVQSMNQGD